VVNFTSGSQSIEDGGPRKWSGGFGEEEYLVPLPDIEPRTVQSRSQSLNRRVFPPPMPNVSKQCVCNLTNSLYPAQNSKLRAVHHTDPTATGAPNTVLGRRTASVRFHVQSKYHYCFSTDPAGTSRAEIRSYQRRESSTTFEEFEPVIEETESKGTGWARPS